MPWAIHHHHSPMMTITCGTGLCHCCSKMAMATCPDSCHHHHEMTWTTQQWHQRAPGCATTIMRWQWQWHHLCHWNNDDNMSPPPLLLQWQQQQHGGTTCATKTTTTTVMPCHHHHHYHFSDNDNGMVAPPMPPKQQQQQHISTTTVSTMTMMAWWHHPCHQNDDNAMSPSPPCHISKTLRSWQHYTVCHSQSQSHSVTNRSPTVQCIYCVLKSHKVDFFYSRPFP